MFVDLVKFMFDKHPVCGVILGLAGAGVVGLALYKGATMNYSQSNGFTLSTIPAAIPTQEKSLPAAKPDNEKSEGDG